MYFMSGLPLLNKTSKVKLIDVEPESRWQNGDVDIEQAVCQGILKPASNMRVSKECWRKGLLFQNT